ncbi:hypothetical protein C8Q79DRAFT_976489 [Trametes meyenii]|nr:hypothetical protein C8Q79DRAFT_976489 [Trametes meyenii]
MSWLRAVHYRWRRAATPRRVAGSRDTLSNSSSLCRAGAVFRGRITVILETLAARYL